MPLVFAWDEWNRTHVTKHGSNSAEAKDVVKRARPPFPREVGGKLLVWGKTRSGRLLEVVFTFRRPDELEFRSLTFLDWSAFIDYRGVVAIYIIHAMPLTERQKREYRRIWSDK